jgi:hypothetical protein
VNINGKPPPILTRGVLKLGHVAITWEPSLHASDHAPTQLSIFIGGPQTSPLFILHPIKKMCIHDVAWTIETYIPIVNITNAGLKTEEGQPAPTELAAGLNCGGRRLTLGYSQFAASTDIMNLMISPILPGDVIFHWVLHFQPRF